MVPPGLKIGMVPPRYGPDKDTVQQEPSLYLLLQVYAWMEYQLLILGFGQRSLSLLAKPIKENQRSSAKKLVA